ncbi:zinc knuckle CX2CX4HX4C containing protein [Tanacetum coccineum]
MEKGFLNGPRSKKDDIDSKSGSSIQDLAKKIKNIDGKLIGKDGKHLKAIRGDPKPAGLGTKVAVEGSNLANVTNAKRSHKSKNNVPNVTPVSYAAMMGNTSNKRVNIKSLVHENGVPGMEQVLANGSWHIRMIPIMLNIWNPTKKLIRDDIKMVPVCVKMHDVPVVAYSEVGLSLITTQVGRPIMLDAHTADMCVNSWGRCSYARLIELNADQTLKESIIVAVLIQGEEGHSLETINIEYEWRPPRCDNCKIFDHLDEDCPRKPKDTSVQNREDGFTQVKGKNKQPKKHTPRYIKGLRINKPKTTLVYRAFTKPSPPKENSSKTSSTNVPSTIKNFINDDLDFMELKNSFDKLREENVILEEVMPAVQEEKVIVNTYHTDEHEKQHGKDVTMEAVASSSKPNPSFGHLDPLNVSDSDEDEVFASQEEHDAYLASMGGGHQLEEDFDMYDDDYADQIRDLRGQIKAFRDFQLHNSGRK